MVETRWRRTFVSSVFALSLALAGCDDPKPKRPAPLGEPLSGPLASPGSSSSPQAGQAKETEDPQAPGPSTSPTQEPAAANYEIAQGTSFVLSDPEDVGPAGPMTASAEGIYFITKADGMYIARRTGDKFEPISAAREDFFKYGRGPALTKHYAYWISASGRLARSKRTGSETEYLVRARSGARVLSLETSPDSVAYLAEEEDHLRAMLWTEGRGPLRASPDSADITSVSVVSGGAFPKLLMLEGRSGLSPLHARTIRFRKGGPELAPDTIVWVGPGSQPLTEVHSAPFPATGGIALVPTAKDIVTFGVAILTLDPQAQAATGPAWVTYPNGIDPAPIALVRSCGESLVFYSVPSEARPRAPQELRVARPSASGFERSEVLVRARAFNEISVAPLSSGERSLGVVLGFTADHRSWAMTVRCKES